MTKLTFNDINFGPHPLGGVFGTLQVNDYKLSVIGGYGFYSTYASGVKPSKTHTPDDFIAFEIAVFDDDGEYVTQKFFDDDHENYVRGWQSRDDINDLINRLYTADLINLVSNN